MLRAKSSCRAIDLIGKPSALCSQRIFAQFSTVIILQECRGGGQVSSALWGQYSRIVDNYPAVRIVRPSADRQPDPEVDGVDGCHQTSEPPPVRQGLDCAPDVSPRDPWEMAPMT